MLRIRKVADATTAPNRAAIEAAQKIMREQFPAMPDYDIAKLPEQLSNPLKHRFVARLFVAENARDQTLGVALLLYAPDIGFSYLEIISTALGRTGRGIGATLYERVREEARALGTQLYFESLPDDPALSPDPAIRANNANRFKFYERYGARPIINTAYETPVTPGTTDPPYLLLDPLGSNDLPSRDTVKKVVRAILERKYGLPQAYVQMVVQSIADDPIRLREPRYTKRPQKAEVRAPGEPRIALVVNDDHTIHHVQERGYVEAPVRIRSIMAELNASGLFEKVATKRFSDRHIRAVHDGRLVDYIRKACLLAGPKKSIYPYVFPTRNPARPPKDETVLAGYYCIDTFTPLNLNAYLAARSAVDCALTAAEKVLEGRRPRLRSGAAARPSRRDAHLRRLLLFQQCGDRRQSALALRSRRHPRHRLSPRQRPAGDLLYALRCAHRVDPRSSELRLSLFHRLSRRDRDRPGRRVQSSTCRCRSTSRRSSTGTRWRRRSAASAASAPAFLVVSAGFDTARGDPTGTWSNRARDFEQLGHMLGEQGYSTLIVQEGGYRVRTLGTNVRNFFTGLVTGHSAARQVAPALARSLGQRPAQRDGLEWRSAVMADDVGRVRSLVGSTGFFNGAEVDIAADLVTERLSKGIRSGYHFILAERGSGLVAYACYGPIEGTQGSFDLFWIAVAPEEQRKGLGPQVFARAESAMRKAGAKKIYVDTSSSDRYAPTRGFYQRMGFEEDARLPDFYGPGDAKVIYVKQLEAGGAA